MAKLTDTTAPGHYLCDIDDIADPGAKGLRLGDRSLFAVKQRGEVYVYQNRCPHIGVELHWQEDQFLDIDETLIQCATHGALFIIETGECVSGPCIGRSLEAVTSRVDNGKLYLVENAD